MNRTDESRTITVVRTRLPYTDRRSLSQAWFSALHLGDAAPPSPAQRAASPPAVDAGSDPRPRASAERAFEDERAAARATGPRRAPHDHAEAADGAVTPASARVRGGARPGAAVAPAMPRRLPSRPSRASLTFGVAGERVALLLRREGATLHVVALCRPAVEGAVRRALVLAGAQVRSNGTALRASVEPFAAGRP